jgi:RNA polymerase sigma-70 factor (ECF subfamily)
MGPPGDAYILEILRLEGLLRAVLHRFAPKPQDLEDLLQETYTRLLAVNEEKRAQITAIQAFALTTARNIAVDWARRKRVVSIDLVEDLDALSVPNDVAQVEDLVNAYQELLQLAEAVATLPRRCGEVYTLRKVYGWSQKEIAAHFGISVSSVENHLTKAVRRCSEHLAKSAQAPGRRGPLAWFTRLRRQGPVRSGGQG